MLIDITKGVTRKPKKATAVAGRETLIGGIGLPDEEIEAGNG
jgi:hypothetical protein